MPTVPLPSPAADRAREEARRHPERETLELATAGAAQVLGADHGVTKALARAAITMAKPDLWRRGGAIFLLTRPRSQPGNSGSLVHLDHARAADDLLSFPPIAARLKELKGLAA